MNSEQKSRRDDFNRRKQVFLLIETIPCGWECGSTFDCILGVYKTAAAAERAKRASRRPDECRIDEWNIDK